MSFFFYTYFRILFKLTESYKILPAKLSLVLDVIHPNNFIQNQTVYYHIHFLELESQSDIVLLHYYNILHPDYNL